MYDRLKVTVLNRREGEIDSLIFKFQDIWEAKLVRKPDFGRGMPPHLWDDYGRVSWCGYKPTLADYWQLSEAVDSYLAVFLEQVHAPCHGQKMG